MTTTPEISNRAVSALAALVHEIRPEWNARGVAGAVHQLAAVPLPDLAIAFVRGAQDPTNETPLALVYPNNRAWDDDHQWRCRRHPDERARRTNGECAACFAERREAPETQLRDRGGRPIPPTLRESMLSDLAVRQRATPSKADAAKVAEARAEIEALRAKQAAAAAAEPPTDEGGEQ